MLYLWRRQVIEEDGDRGENKVCVWRRWICRGEDENEKEDEDRFQLGTVKFKSYFPILKMEAAAHGYGGAWNCGWERKK
ncbi:hypothetical protein DITRI_Ditri08aG0162600 [Diplodiscus trichospermus]